MGSSEQHLVLSRDTWTPAAQVEALSPCLGVPVCIPTEVLAGVLGVASLWPVSAAEQPGPLTQGFKTQEAETTSLLKR